MGRSGLRRSLMKTALFISDDELWMIIQMRYEGEHREVALGPKDERSEDLKYRLYPLGD